jgi:hypothetical protein
MFLPVMAAFYGGNIRQDPAPVVNWQEFELLERVIDDLYFLDCVYDFRFRE